MAPGNRFKFSANFINNMEEASLHQKLSRLFEVASGETGVQIFPELSNMTVWRKRNLEP